MYSCPSCKAVSIPVWRPLIPDYKIFSFRCKCCGSKIRRVKSIKDFSVGIPLVVSVIYANKVDVTPAYFAVFTFGVSTLAGICFWLLLVKYEIIKEEPSFIPHSNQLKPK